MIHDHAFLSTGPAMGLCIQGIDYGEGNYRLCGKGRQEHGELHQKVMDHEYSVGSPSMECGFTYPIEGHGSDLKCGRPANQHTRMSRCSHGPRQNCRDIDCQHCIGGGCPMIH